MIYRRHLVHVSTVLLGLAIATALVTVSVDPYATFRWTDIRGFNDQKNLKRDGGRVNKAVILDRHPFDVLLYGTSQGEMGMNPASEVFAGLSAFNASLSYTNLYELSRATAYAAQRQSPRMVVMALDWFSFSTSRITSGDFSSSGFSGASHFPVYVKRIFGWQAIRDSVSVFRRSWQHKSQVFTKLGFVDPSVRGPYDHAREFRSSLRKYMRPEPHPDSPPETRRQESFPSLIYDPGQTQVLRRMMMPFLDKGAKVLLFISPVHAAYMDILIDAGRLADYEDWKRDLTAMVAAVNKDRPGAVALWDFSGYNSVTTEPVPDSPAARMRWYWDAAHFSAATGDLVMARMLGRDAPSGAVPDDFGVELLPDTVDAVLRRLHEDRARYRSVGQHPPDVADQRFGGKGAVVAKGASFGMTRTAQ